MLEELERSDASPGRMARFATIIRRHQCGVWRYLRWLGCTRDEADDLTQEAFVSMLRSAFVEQTPAATRSYLCTTAARLYSALRRRAGVAINIAYLDAVAVADEREREHEWGTPDELLTLRRCVERLPERHQMVVEWYYRDGMSWQAIGERLVRRANGVKTMLQRLRKKLRGCVEREMKTDNGGGR